MFDLSAQIERGLGVPSQLQQRLIGNDNWNENCVPTSFAMLMAALGYGSNNPEALTDYAYGPLYHGPEYFMASIDYIYSHSDWYPNPPEIYMPYPDPSAEAALAIVDEAAQSGYASVLAFWISCSTVWIAPGPLDCGHASIPAAWDGQTWKVLNVWSQSYQYLSNSEMIAAYSGGVAVVRRSLNGNTAAAVVVEESEGEEMDVIDWEGEQHGAFVSAKGVLTHWHYDPASGQLLSEALATDLKPLGRVRMHVPDRADTPGGSNELHIFAQFPDGALGNWWFAKPGAAWNAQTIAPAAV